MPCNSNPWSGLNIWKKFNLDSDLKWGEMSSIWLCTVDWHSTWKAKDLTSLCTECLKRYQYETVIMGMAKCRNTLPGQLQNRWRWDRVGLAHFFIAIQRKICPQRATSDDNEIWIQVTVISNSVFYAVKNNFVVLQTRMSLVGQKQEHLGYALFDQSLGMSCTISILVFSPLNVMR